MEAKLRRSETIVARAEKAFGDADKAHVWLNREMRQLNGQTPMDACATESGLLAVLDLLNRLEYGLLA